MDNNLVDIIRSVVDEINTTLNVVSIDVDKIYLVNTLHLTIDKHVLDSGGNKYNVIDFVINAITINVDNTTHASHVGTTRCLTP